jgi:hypothetical protein
MSETNGHPKVFVSHASEDKDRFVIPFAARLRAKGIDAWVDEWEILPGDSLVDKIFEEGLKDAEAIIIVLSHFSVNKPWVREELNVSVVQRIERNCRIIPVVLDDCEVPQSLRSTLWQSIPDLHAYDVEFDRVVNAVYGHYSKPPLGEPPAYVTTDLPQFAGLAQTDSAVLKLACEKAVEERIFYVGPGSFAEEAEALEIADQELHDCLRVLDNVGYIKAYDSLSGDIGLIEITPSGFAAYARACVPEYDELVKRVGFYLLNECEDQGDSQTIGQALDCPELLVEHAFDVFEGKGYIETIKPGDGGASAVNISPALRRWLQSL